MDLEKVALEAVKVKIQEIFDGISITTNMEGKSIVIKINLPNEIGNKIIIPPGFHSDDRGFAQNDATKLDLDREAQSAADELLGVQEQ